MKYFLDTEFIEDGHTIDLISIGIVDENGVEFYAISSEANYNKAYANLWVRENVLRDIPLGLPHIPDREVIINTDAPHVCTRAEIADRLLNYLADTLIGPEDPIEFWAYYADYDWVVLCQLFGTMKDLPAGFPMFCMDIKQLAVSLGNPRLPEQDKGQHNALADAHWNVKAHQFLMEHQRGYRNG